MTVRLLLFAALADQLGVRKLKVTLPDNATVATALDTLVTQHAAAADHREGLATAVNMTYVGPEHALADGDEIALIPPVSGG